MAYPRFAPPALLAVTLLACGGDDPGDTADASRGAADASPTAADAGVDAMAVDPRPACADVAVAPPAPRVPGRHDGTYVEVDDASTSVTPSCFPGERAPATFAYYVRLDRGHFWPYRRHYPTLSACQAATFDTGGTIENLSSTELRDCGPTYQSSVGSFRQGAFMVPDDVGDTFSPLYMFSGRGPVDARWDELILSDVRSNAPMALPGDLTFRRYRRAR